MQSINESPFASNKARPERHIYRPQWRGSRPTPLRRARAIRVFIASNFAHGAAYYAAVIYAGTSVTHCFDGWLDDSTSERAWLHALGLAYEWRDRHAHNARLIICESKDKHAHRRAA